MRDSRYSAPPLILFHLIDTSADPFAFLTPEAADPALTVFAIPCQRDNSARGLDGKPAVRRIRLRNRMDPRTEFYPDRRVMS
jgi:hypothetical protein